MSTNSIILAFLKLCYLLSDLNRYLTQDQILSLTCLPIPPSRLTNLNAVFFKMPQFDFTTISVVTTSVCLCVSISYSFFSILLLSEIVILSKFRNKLSGKNTKNLLNDVSIPGVLVYKSIVKSL